MFKDIKMDIYFKVRMEYIRDEVWWLIENLTQHKHFLKQYKQKHLSTIDSHYFNFVSRIWYESMILRLNKLNDKKDLRNTPYSFYETIDRLIIEFSKNPITLSVYKTIFPDVTDYILLYFFDTKGKINIDKINSDKNKLNKTINSIAKDAADKYFRHMDPKYSGGKVSDLNIRLLDIKKGVSLVKKYISYYYPFLTGKSFSFESQKPRWGIIFRTSKQAEKIRKQIHNKNMSLNLKKIIHQSLL